MHIGGTDRRGEHRSSVDRMNKITDCQRHKLVGASIARPIMVCDKTTEGKRHNLLVYLAIRFFFLSGRPMVAPTDEMLYHKPRIVATEF